LALSKFQQAVKDGNWAEAQEARGKINTKFLNPGQRENYNQYCTPEAIMEDKNFYVEYNL